MLKNLRVKRLEAKARRLLTETIRVTDNLLYLSYTDTYRLLNRYTKVSRINRKLFFITKDKTYLFEAIYWRKKVSNLVRDDAWYRTHWTTTDGRIINNKFGDVELNAWEND